MKLRKLSVLIAAVIVLTAILTACTGGQTAEPKISVKVVITAQEEILSETVSVEEGATADKAIVAACQSKKLAYTLKDGMFDYFGAEASTQTDGWLFYVNGVLAEIGAAQYDVKDGDTLEFKYQNYDEAFDLS